jgi:2-hydroxycyclohexanecarboxyl-CoA dehydrogenase
MNRWLVEQAGGGEEMSGRVAVVTGAGDVVASAIVERLRAGGFRVAGLDAQRAVGDLTIDVDLTDRSAIGEAAERVSRELGPVSVLVTVPRVHDAAPFGEMDAGRWDRLLGGYLAATANACRAIVPSMVSAGRGTVACLTSWKALAGIPGEAYEAAAAGSLLAFTKSFAVEVAPAGVRVNCIAVGPLEPHDGQDAVRPQDVAETVMFLVDDGEFFVGQVLSAAAGAVV